MHGVWKSQKKSHSTLLRLRPKFIKIPKMVNLKIWSLRSKSVTGPVNFNKTKLVKNAKKCSIWKPETYGQSVTRQANLNETKIDGKCQNYKNATFWVIFKQCESCKESNLEHYLCLMPRNLGYILPEIPMSNVVHFGLKFHWWIWWKLCCWRVCITR